MYPVLPILFILGYLAIILYYILSYCIILYYIILFWDSLPLYRTILYHTVLYYTRLYCFGIFGHHFSALLEVPAGITS